jgi:hypothetical protein
MSQRKNSSELGCRCFCLNKKIKKNLKYLDNEHEQLAYRTPEISVKTHMQWFVQNNIKYGVVWNI